MLELVDMSAKILLVDRINLDNQVAMGALGVTILPENIAFGVPAQSVEVDGYDTEVVATATGGPFRVGSTQTFYYNRIDIGERIDPLVGIVLSNPHDLNEVLAAIKTTFNLELEETYIDLYEVEEATTSISIVMRDDSLLFVGMAVIDYELADTEMELSDVVTVTELNGISYSQV